MDTIIIAVNDKEWQALLSCPETEIKRPADEKHRQEFVQMFHMYPHSKVPVGTDEHDVIFRHGKNTIRRACVLSMDGDCYALKNSPGPIQA